MATQTAATMSDLLIIFDDTLEHYQQNAANGGHQVEVAERLRQLRTSMHENLPTIAETFVQTMEPQPNLVRLNETQREFIVFGDMHGSLTDLVKLRQTYWRDAEQLTRLHFVFLGDYVDKGIHGFEVALYLMLRKLVFPESFTVIRGNHEIQWQNRTFFLKECQAKFENNGREVWKTFNKCFSMLPFAAVLNGNVFCCHGGIPRMLNSLDEINDLTKVPKGLVSEMRHQVALQILWNDFRTTDTDRKRLYDEDDSEQEERQEQAKNFSVRKYFVDNSQRDIGLVVGHKAVRNFLRKHKLNYIVRAHQFDNVVRMQGYNTHSGKKVVTVFSNSQYMGNSNATACARVNHNSVNIIPICPAHRQNEVRSEIFESEDLANLIHDQ